MDGIDLNKRYLVLGVGVTGASVARYLLQRGCVVRVADSRPEHASVQQLKQDFPDLDLVLGEFGEQLLDGVEVLVINPGISRQLPVVRSALSAGVDVVGDIELFAQEVDCPVIAVTGTNGKSTVVSMLESMGRFSALRVLCGGNIGEPALNLLGQQADLVVLELSSYQLESTTGLKPVVACILNVSEDHMDRYDSLADYAAAKQGVYNQAEHAVCLKGDALSAPVGSRAVVQVVSEEQPQADDYGVRDGWLCRGDEALFDLAQLGASGWHNQINACFAWAIASLSGLPRTAMEEGLRAFKGLKHRTELIAEIEGVKYINDSKGTNVGATLVALRSMPCKVVLLAGGDGKSQDFRPLLPALRQCARVIVTYGADGDQLAEIASGVVPVERAESLEAAVAVGKSHAEPGDCVLLSPACASFDMFKSYQDRGRAFVECVERLRA
ncbi:MAG: UDP-N-acetylmuramoyl-L-alanine--D-glutamate ligase [Granulosicoccaceae bacterium]